LHVLKCNAHRNQSDNSKRREQIEKANAHLRKKEKGTIYKRLWPTCKNHSATDPNLRSINSFPMRLALHSLLKSRERKEKKRKRENMQRKRKNEMSKSQSLPHQSVKCIKAKVNHEFSSYSNFPAKEKRKKKQENPKPEECKFLLESTKKRKSEQRKEKCNTIKITVSQPNRQVAVFHGRTRRVLPLTIFAKPTR
jgi:hypothetical protein